MIDSAEAQAAIIALRRISRNEDYKARVMETPLLHRALLGAVSRFIGGEDVAGCLPVARGLHQRGIATAIDYMGESTRDRDRASVVTQEFLRVIATLADRGPAASISPDLSHLGMAIDPQAAYENARLLAGAARDANTEVVLNMEGSDRTETILAIHRRLCQRHDNVGVTLQAYLYRTDKDLTDAIERPGRIRLVKGAYAEPPEVARPLGPPTDTAFRTLMETLLVSGHRCSIATHDPALLEHAHRFIESRRLPREPIEFELNYGIAEDRLRQMQALGYAVRVYLPYGEEWYLYLCHRLAEYPPNIYQALADALSALP
ncbi:MAG: proline dehydrogenase family protein [Thermoanaerobaculia bacterium]